MKKFRHRVIAIVLALLTVCGVADGASASIVGYAGGVMSAGDPRGIAVNPVDKSVWVTVQQAPTATRIDRFTRTENGYVSTPARTHTLAGKFIRTIDFGSTGKIYALTGLFPNEVAVTIGTPNYSVSAISASLNFSLGGFDAYNIEVDSANRIYVGTLTGNVRIYTPTNAAGTGYVLWKSFRVTECYGNPECAMGFVIQPGTQKLWIRSASLKKYLIYNTALSSFTAASATMKAGGAVPASSLPGLPIFMPNGQMISEWADGSPPNHSSIVTTLPTQTGVVTRPISVVQAYGFKDMRISSGIEGDVLGLPNTWPRQFLIWRVTSP